MPAQIGARDWLPRRGHQIGHQALATRLVLAHGDCGLRHLSVLGQGDLDLTQFDAIPAYFHLVVGAAQELQLAIGALPHQIARAIAARVRVRGLGIGQETLLGEILPTQVPARQGHASDIELALAARRDRTARLVEHGHGDVGQGATDGWQGRPVCGLAGQPVGCNHVGLRGPVLVLQRALRETLEELGDVSGDAQGLARGDDLAQADGQQAATDRHLGELLQGHEGQKQPADAGAVYLFEQAGWIRAGFLVGQHQGSARGPGGEHLLEGDVERERRQLHGLVTLAANRGLSLPVQQIEQGAVDHGHALGSSGRARGVDDIRQVIGAARAGRSLLAFSGKPAPRRVHTQNRHVRAGKPNHRAGVGQRDHRVGISQHERQPLGRVLRIERQVRPARLEHAQHGDRHVHGTWQADGHRDIRLDTQFL